MVGQISIFDILKNDTEVLEDGYEYSWDNDINEIHYKLVNLVSRHRISIQNDKWEIWSHVPHFGYRMSFSMNITSEMYTEELFQELQEIVDFAEERQVELSVMNPIFYSDIGTLYVFSMFMDKKRQKVK